MNELVRKLQTSYPAILFVEGNTFMWKPKEKTIVYLPGNSEKSAWSLLHEVGHGLLGHNSYTSDLQLVKKEVDAWRKAQEIAPLYGLHPDDNYVQDCLDSYRDWINKRSTCPVCRLQGIQRTPTAYGCLNCKTTWHVTPERFCRPYRRLE